MRDELLAYYERELTWVRQLGAEFAARYPKIAGRLVLEPDRCEDPHVERLIEAFAFLAARVHLKVDDEFPEIAESLLGILHPHYVRPVPSLSIVQMHPDPQANLASGLNVPAGSMLYSRPVDGEPCKFKTSYDVTIWPVAISDAHWRTPDRLRPALSAPDAAAACRVELRCNQDVTFAALGLRSLRFHLTGDSTLVHALYELLDNRCLRIVIRDLAEENPAPPVVLSRSCLRPVGFGDEEAVLPVPRRSFTGYRLLQEYFALPEKFFFFELSGLEVLSKFHDKVEIIFLIGQDQRTDREQVLQLGVGASTFRLNCTPIVNLFRHTAEPILLEQTTYEYKVLPDVRRPYALEIFSIDEVIGSRPGSSDLVHYEPFYSYRHGLAHASKTFWHATRRASQARNDSGTDIWISLADLSGREARPQEDTLTIRCTCTNRDLPSRLPFGNDAGDFELESGTLVRRIVCLRKPTPTLRSPSGKALLWRQVSHLSLNYLSLVDEGREALQEILRLYNFSGESWLEKQISGIASISSRRHFARVSSPEGISFARGTRVDLELDEDQFAGAGAYLFAAVREYFLGLYVSLNSFSQLALTTRQRKEPVRVWQPRAGHRILL